MVSIFKIMSLFIIVENIYLYIQIYLQNPSNNITTPVINISTSNKFEFLKEEPPNQNQSPIHQTSQSFANFDNNPAFSTSFDNSKNIGMYYKYNIIYI